MNLNERIWSFSIIGLVVAVLLGITVRCASATTAPILPNSAITPGDVRTTDTKSVCTTRTSTVRNVPQSEKQSAFARYHIAYTNHASYEVDHLISLELGGSNDIKNLWPEAWNLDDGQGHDVGAHTKDRVENALHKAVCQKKITLTAAQKAIRTNWLSAYLRWVGQFPEMKR